MQCVPSSEAASLKREVGSSSMSMIDYDARPVTPQIVLVGHRASAVGYSIRDFLSRNGVPYVWVDVDDTERVAGLLAVQETDPDQLPVCILPNGTRLAPATLEGSPRGWGWCQLRRCRSTT